MPVFEQRHRQMQAEGSTELNISQPHTPLGRVLPGPELMVGGGLEQLAAVALGAGRVAPMYY